jgi:hypothetical protein
LEGDRRQNVTPPQFQTRRWDVIAGASWHQHFSFRKPSTIITDNYNGISCIISYHIIAVLGQRPTATTTYRIVSATAPSSIVAVHPFIGIAHFQNESPFGALPR